MRSYGLTTQAPAEVWPAIGPKDRAPRPEGIRLRIVRVSGEARDAGVETHVVEGVPVRIYRATVRSYIERLKTSRGPLTGEQEDRIEERFDRLRDLGSYPFEVVELDAEMDEEPVADVFVRINSEGVALNRADFILTLMSVFQESSRKQL